MKVPDRVEPVCARVSPEVEQVELRLVFGSVDTTQTNTKPTTTSVHEVEPSLRPGLFSSFRLHVRKHWTLYEGVSQIESLKTSCDVNSAQSDGGMKDRHDSGRPLMLLLSCSCEICHMDVSTTSNLWRPPRFIDFKKRICGFEFWKLNLMSSRFLLALQWSVEDSMWWTTTPPQTTAGELWKTQVVNKTFIKCYWRDLYFGTWHCGRRGGIKK